MDLQKHLDEGGYTQALEKFNAAKGIRDIVAGDIDTLPNKEMIPQLRRQLAELEAWIVNAERAFAREYAAAVKYVDAENVVELNFLQMEEIAELVAEEFDKTDPEAGANIRAIMRGERPA